MSQPIIGVNHVGYVVNDLDAASTFFVDVLGFEALPRKGSTLSPNDERMTSWFGVHPESVARWAFFTFNGSIVELMEWTAPDHSTVSPRNSDVGGRHLALSTSNLDEAIEHLRAQPGVQVRDKTEAGFAYVLTPFGLEIQLMPH